MSGWISIHRKIQEHWLWEDKPFSKGQAWIDLILMANYKDNKLLLGSELLEVKRGSLVTSEYKLMDRWGWSKTKVRNFLDLLEKDSMIIRESDPKKTTLTIVNYSDYQDVVTTKEPEGDHRETTQRLQEDQSNKDNNDKKETALTIVDYSDCQDITTTEELQKDYKETTEEPHKNPNNKDNKENKENNIIMAPYESEYISVLEKIKDYPLDRKKDLDYMRELEERYPTLDLVEAINKFSIWVLDNPFRKNANHRSQINTSFSKYTEWGACLKQIEAPKEEYKPLKMIIRDDY